MDKIINECKIACNDLIKQAKLNAGDIVVIGCSTSEVLGSKWGTNSNYDVGSVLFETIYKEFKANGIFITPLPLLIIHHGLSDLMLWNVLMLTRLQVHGRILDLLRRIMKII
jgi:hypothetical protein